MNYRKRSARSAGVAVLMFGILACLSPQAALATGVCTEIDDALEGFTSLLEVYEQTQVALEQTVAETQAQLQDPGLEPSARVALTRFIRARNEARRDLRKNMKDIEVIISRIVAYRSLEACP